MQHIVNVAFDFDDRKIGEYIETQCQRDVLEECVKQAMKQLNDLAGGEYRWERNSVARYVADKVVDRVIDEHGNEIIDLAATALAMRLSSRNKWRDVIAEARVELGMGGSEGADEA